MSDLFSGSLAAQEGPSVSSPAKSRLAKPAPGNRTGRARLKAQGDADRASAKEIGNPLKNNNQFSASSNPGQRPPLLCHSGQQTLLERAVTPAAGDPYLAGEQTVAQF